MRLMKWFQELAKAMKLYMVYEMIVLAIPF